ncbi:MAG: molybdopterin-dependent oxidoreductase [bacterium]
MDDCGSAPRPPDGSGAGRRTVYSMCGMCSVRCPIQVEVRDGRAVWIQGNPHDRAMGSSLCAKGSAGLSFQYEDDERPRYPMIRTGPRGGGGWRRASWDEAIDFVARGIEAAAARHGPRAVALSDRGGPFTDLTRSFLKALGSPNYFNHDCTCGANAHHATLSLFGVGRKGVAYDIAHTRHLVLYGRNLLESLQVKEAKEFVHALSEGARCTYIDPRATLTASRATCYWQIRPGTDYALNLALIHTVLRENLHDAAFTSGRVSGIEALREFVADKTPEWQEPFTGIPANRVRDLAREVAADAPSIIFHAGWMTARNRQSFYVSRTCHILNSLFGAVEAPGGVILARGPAECGRKPLRKLADRIPRVQEKRVDGCGWKDRHFDGKAGLLHRLFPAIETGEPYRVAAYIAYRHDPLLSLPDTGAVQRALDRLELVVSVDVNFSETAWRSDVILPESTYLERANILALREGPVPCIYMRDQAVAPRFDTRPAWWIFRELARRLGAGRHFDFETIEDVWDYQLDGTGISAPEIRKTGVFPLAERPALPERTSDARLKTPSGMVELLSTRLEEAGVESFAPFRPPAPLGADEFRLLVGRSAVHTHGQTMNNPLLHEILPENALWVHPDRAAPLGLADGDLAEVSRQGVAATCKVKVTPWIHRDAVFLIHGFGRTVPAQTRACRKGVADQLLQKGMLSEYDPAGGGNALCDTVVRVGKAGPSGAGGRNE